MKLIAILLFISSLHVSARGISQTITISVKNAPLEQVFKLIEKQTDFVFLFDKELLATGKRVTINVSKPLVDVLDLCFKDQPFTYIIADKIIALAPRKEYSSMQIETNIEDRNALINIQGKVISPSDEPVVGATISVKGGNQTTLTNNSGEFVLNDVQENAILIITSVGFEQREINVSGHQSITLRLQLRVTSLDEIQVIGYGQTVKRLNTGNVSTVKEKDIEKQPVNNPLLALQGRVPGMFVTQSKGLPGSGVTVQIRGRNSIANGNDPLFIIDGVPYASENINSALAGYILGNSNSAAGNPFSYINPSDIESISILKDADATAIYGSRGANGVVLITTKKGKPGVAKIDINLQNGWGKVAHKMDLLNTRQYLDMRYEAFRNDGVVPNPNADYDLTLWDTARYTDWQKELIGGTSYNNDLQASISAGNSNIQYLIAAAYHKETTVFPGDFNDQKGSVHFNINSISSNQKFKVLLSGVYTADKNQLSEYDLTEQAMQLAPDAPPMYNSDGTLNWAPNAAGISSWPFNNPAAMMLLTYNNKTYNLVSNSVVSFLLLPGLEIKSNFGYTNMQTNEVSTIPLTVYDPAVRAYRPRQASFTNNNIQSWIIEPQLNYNLKVNDGTFTALAGATFQRNSNYGQLLNASGFNSDFVLRDISSATSVTPATLANTVYKYNAFFIRLNYNWQAKYLLNLTGRRDGSSRFGPARQFHNFGAIGAAWIFTKNALFQKAMPLLSNGKIRASYGTTGSDQVGDYTFMDLYNPASYGIPYQGSSSLAITRIFTPDLAWEETKKLEGGLELGFINDRIIFNASYYRNRSSNQLMGYNLPAVTGFTSVQKNLPALVQNEGWEFEATTVNIKKGDFRWTSSVNLTINRNKLVAGANGLNAAYLEKVGHSLSSRFVFHFLGVDPITGLYQVADSHGSPTATPNLSTDLTTLIDLAPKFYGGFDNSLSYKGLQFDFLFQFVRQNGHNYLYNSRPGYFSSDGSNQPVSVLNRWQKPGDVSSIQRFSQDYSVLNSYANASLSDQVYSDASYIRLKNASISWQLPKSWGEKVYLRNSRIYMHGQNLLTITNYKGLDPETRSSTSLPPLRVITLGIQVIL